MSEASRSVEASGKPSLQGSPSSLERLNALAAQRIAIEAIDPEIDGGRFPAKTVVGETLIVEADIFGDGHETFDAAILYRDGHDGEWLEAPMEYVINDRWRGEILFSVNGPAQFTLIAWRDLFAQWAKEIRKKIAAGQNVSLEITEGKNLVQAALDDPRDGALSRTMADALSNAADEEALLALLLSEDTAGWMKRAAPRTNLTRYDKDLPVWVDRKAAAFSAWYELMPRSITNDENRHGTFRDVIERLPYVQDLGFDVLYFTPIHPIGKTNRKGRNNTLTPGPDDVGSPYAIGSADGGHDAVHPELGTIEDFDALVAAAHQHGLEIALDFAIQCSPDHPWIKEHPEWFDWRPDGTIKFAENPPKKYEDIVNVHFYRGAIPDLWYALRDVVLYWVDHGVKIFRVDNPHTKPFPFWEWMIDEVHREHPDVIFLAEAFTRPKVMKRLAKVGYSQSYSYFTWRNLKWELEQYLTELTTEECRHYMRVNFFANTPDINPVYLQTSGRPGFRTRLVLAATLAGNYGLYNGYEICDAAPVPGKEEYLDSEKYQIRIWDMDQPGHIKDDIRLVNRLRRENPALQRFLSLKFFYASNANILYYGKFDPATSNYLLFHVNLDPHNVQSCQFEVPLWEFGLSDHASVEVEDLLQGNRFTWHGKTHNLELDPQTRPYAIWRLYPPGAPRP
ncbi:alpha-1,4-glucan--maltose-1-phosphate maltosyltransferase [Tianweitania sediminis]|uniref:Alpha-1,4-glucan:maltose-1-phosphate maltosyltransferase n=1 Tax=Tianweitania sediminis TaxID=1502156 RepID=A0A8J7R2U3_9HYPH|nr:alpha-1,4-glucan--maltose-1-phosphate maltosyltransferase [Tianweitania sediminis]MBP0440597.1 alpha-1,4-glucan--maltose-1-phosphate maltosyltransferase [Tianweitania sediminis]